ncbi:hypothetical protein B0H10DRAFT_2050898 [Mycena sp. CBHHK59/15]|nr:hypothetical protein B0H10DRAFT_2050898 [Mycena sp. CBHHK59/15]
MVDPTKLVAAASPTFPPNPHFATGPKYPTDTATASSARSSTATTKEEKKFRNQLLKVDQFCFVTGSATASLQACHVLNAVRKTKHESASQAAQRKERIERFLTDQRILNDQEFRLDTLPNGVLLKPDIHVAWDLYASICLCPTLSTLYQVAASFAYCNKRWDRAVTAARKMVPRPLPNLNSLSQPVEWQLVVLHPRTFLPYNEPLLVSENPPLLTSDSSLDLSTYSPQWEAFSVDQTTLSLVRSDGTALSMTHRSGVASSARLSVVAMIINANSKLEYAAAQGWVLPAALLELKEVTADVFAEFFYIPDVHTLTMGSHAPDIHMGSGHPHSPRDNPSGHHHRESIDNEPKTPMAPSHPPLSSSSVDQGGRESGSEQADDENEEEDEDEDDDHYQVIGAEFDMAMDKVQNGSIPSSERHEILRLLLGKPYETRSTVT